MWESGKNTRRELDKIAKDYPTRIYQNSIKIESSSVVVKTKETVENIWKVIYSQTIIQKANIPISL